jgi:hypothetical protein
LPEFEGRNRTLMAELHVRPRLLAAHLFRRQSKPLVGATVLGLFEPNLLEAMPHCPAHSETA